MVTTLRPRPASTTPRVFSREEPIRFSSPQAPPPQANTQARRKPEEEVGRRALNPHNLLTLAPSNRPSLSASIHPTTRQYEDHHHPRRPLRGVAPGRLGRLRRRQDHRLDHRRPHVVHLRQLPGGSHDHGRVHGRRDLHSPWSVGGRGREGGVRGRAVRVRRSGAVCRDSGEPRFAAMALAFFSVTPH